MKAENSGKVFGSQPEFGIKVDPPKLKGDGSVEDYERLKIQVGSKKDYTNITGTMNFKDLAERMVKSQSY